MANRRVEYYSALVLIGWSVTLLLPGNTISGVYTYMPLLYRGWSEEGLAYLFGIVGVLWLGALWVNGNHRRSPVIRCMGAFTGVLIWLNVTLLFLGESLKTGIWSPSIPAYGLLMLFDLASCYRSASDAYHAHVQGRILDRLAGKHDSHA